MGELRGKEAFPPPFASVVEAFKTTAAAHGQLPALLLQNGQSLSYQDLDEISDIISRKVHKFARDQIKNSNDGETVMLAMSPGPKRVIAILALWKLNMSYIPIEASVPKRRIKLIIREVQPLLVLTCDELKGKFRSSDVYAEGINRVITYDDLMKYDEATEHVERVSKPNDRICILYTSGSTGTPKGVVLTNHNLLNRLQWQWQRLPFQENEVGIAKTSLLFVDSLTEIWSFLLRGKPIVVMEEDMKNVRILVKTMQEFDVSRLVVVPSLLHAILSHAKMFTINLPALKLVICSGERLSTELATEFFRQWPDKELFNFYGSTEVTGDATYANYKNVAQVEELSMNKGVAIGKPIDGVSVKLVNERGEVVGENEIGEIVVQGPTVMPGYFGSQLDGSTYNTGDFGQIVDGLLYFIGRHDDQIKILGNRVDLMEIQNVLEAELKTPVVVIAINADTRAAKILAFVEGDSPIKDKAKQISQTLLAEYMRPLIVPIDNIPLTETTGKVDRQKLKDFYKSNIDENQSILDPELRKFIEIVADELQIPAHIIHLDDDFTSIGGNSINKTQLFTTFFEQGNKLDFIDFINAMTIESMYQTTKKLTHNHPPMSNDDYEIVIADEKSPHEKINALIYNSFKTKDPFVIGCKLTQTEGELMNKVLYNIAFSEQSVFLFKEKKTGELVAVAMCYDSSRFEIPEGMEIPESIELLLEILEHVQSFLVDAVPETERVYEFISWSTIPRLNADENLRLTRLCEEFVVKVAKERGYYAVTCENTNNVTQLMAEQLGYVTKGSVILKDYTRPDGSKPFQDSAPPEVVLKAQIKYLNE